jgi:uncharacterized protein (DUF427 family)
VKGPLPSAHELLPLVRRARSSFGSRPQTIDVPKPGQESVWDFPRPPRVEPVAARVRVVFGGVTIVDSSQALRIVETAGAPCYYVPPGDVLGGALRATGDWSVCEWKGAAVYYDVIAGGKIARAAAWAYPEPLTDLGCGYERIANYVAFYCAKMDGCFLDDERVRPQPGGFYGGWVTDSLAGPIKGVPGSDGW